MAFSEKLGYKNVANTTAVVKATPAGFFGLTCTVTGDVTVYDNASAGSGTILFTKTGIAVGETIHFGGNGISANNGLTVATTGTVNVLYT